MNAGSVKKNRLFVLALDGTPYSFLQKAMQLGIMPNFKKLAEASDFRSIHSVIPPVSSVAWASFMTGKKPHQHGIMGFIERDPSTMEWYVPLSDRLKGRTLWEILSDHGKRVFVMNVPMTYPPRKINGISICGFLGSDITKGTYPPEIGMILKARGYRIDADTELAKKNLHLFFNDLLKVLDKRIEIMEHYLQQERWDFFMTHIMETDRLHHFFWELMATGKQPFVQMFFDFYSKIDRLIGKIQKNLADDTHFLLLSDHGFTTLKQEFYLNRWLWEQGLLKFNKQPPGDLKDLHVHTKAYSLYPGRIYINLQGREKRGSVRPGLEYEQIRQQLEMLLKEVRDPKTGVFVFSEVVRGEALYGSAIDHNKPSAISGGNVNNMIPDLVAVAAPGYDIKGNLWHPRLFDKTIFNGCHTFDDAFVLLNGATLTERMLSIVDMFDIILDLTGLEQRG